MENKDIDVPEQEPDIVGDAPPVASSKKKKVILVGCGFCVLLFLVCAGIGLPMLAKLRRNVQEFSEKIKAEDDARIQRLEEQHEMPQEDSGNSTKATNDTEWIVEALAVRLGENELEHKQLVNTFGSPTPSKERFLCRWLEKGKAIEMVGEIIQKTEQGDQVQRMYMVCRYDPKKDLFVQTVTVDGKSQPGIDLTWNRNASRFEAEHSLPEPVGAKGKLFFKWTDNRTLEGDYKITQVDKVLLHSVSTGRKTKTTANDKEFDLLKASILQPQPDSSSPVSPVDAASPASGSGDLKQLWAYGLISRRTGASLIEPGGAHKIDKTKVSYGYNQLMDRTGRVLRPGGRPLQGGERLILTTEYQKDANVREYARIFTYMAPIRDALLYNFDNTTKKKWLELTQILKINKIKTTPAKEIGPRTILSIEQVYDYIKQRPREGSPVMRFLEEAELELKCLAFDPTKSPIGGGQQMTLHCQEHGTPIGSGLKIPKNIP